MSESKSYLRVALGFFAALFIFGFTVGHAASPDWTDRVTVMKVLALNLRASQTESGPVLSADCGIKTYSYYPSSDQLVRTALPEVELQKAASRRRGGMDATTQIGELLFGSEVTSGAVLASGVAAGRPKNTGRKFVALAAVFAVVGIGFYAGYDGAPDCEAAEKVYQDPEVWRSFAQSRLGSGAFGASASDVPEPDQVASPPPTYEATVADEPAPEEPVLDSAAFVPTPQDTEGWGGVPPASR